MADVAARGETVVPHCPVVARYLRKNDVPGLTDRLARTRIPREQPRDDPPRRRPHRTRRPLAEGSADFGPRWLLLDSREVPLGGVRGMEVHRSLPQRDLPMVGAWCFLDRFGPQVTRMRVEPHPHIGLQTVTWPFVGEVRHRDTVGSDVVVKRGALNLMTSGAGIAHSEYSVGEEAIPLDALQLWVALPEHRRHGAPAFERHDDLPIVDLPAIEGTGCRGRGGARRVRRRRLPGDDLHPDRRRRDPRPGRIARAASPRPGVGVRTRGHRRRTCARRRTRPRRTRHPKPTCIPCDSSTSARDAKAWSSRATEGATLFLLGGEPFEDDIVMWWNFVGRTHDEIVEARDAWEAGSDRFGRVVGHGDVRIPAPPMPAVRLTQRRRRA